ncbi:MAG: DegV family protein [Dehalococcoidia bacterium]|nr:DegV family protein [Dehalococcoidia bacterium]
MAVRLVTDSTASIPSEVFAQLHITVIPLTVVFGETAYQDGVDLDNATFFAKLKQASQLPHTTQPSPAAFTEAYDALLAQGHTVLSVHVSSALSGTLNSAHLGRDACSAPNGITVIDSRLTSMSLGLAVIAGARAAETGSSLDEVRAAVESVLAGVELLLFVDTLEYLQRGGRIGAARAFLGSLLNVKPLITLRNGAVEPVGQVRTRARALERLREWAAEHTTIRGFSVLHTASLPDAQALFDELHARFPAAEAYLVECGPVVATHVGPGGVGLTLYA